MVQIGDQRVIKDFFSTENPRDFNPLISPTTPLQFEVRQQQQPPQQAYDNPWLQNSLQLQLLNYIRSFHGAQQIPPVDCPQQMPQYMQQQQLVGGSPNTVERHPTITLLQQRFQRLEKDREMRHAKQLWAEGTFPSTSCSGDCNLQLSLPQARLRAGNSPDCESPGRNYPRVSPSNRRDHSVVFVEERKSAQAELKPARAAKSKLVLSLLPSETEQLRTGYKTSDSSPSATSPYCNNGQRETQFLLKDWKSEKASLPAVAADDEVDTSLHL